jgi:VanZ family protein
MNPSDAAHVEFSEIPAIRWLHRHRRGLVAFVYVFFVAYATLLPFDFHWAIGERHLANVSRAFETNAEIHSSPDVVLNVVLYVPLGAAVCLAVYHRLRRWWVGMLVGCLAGGLLSVTIEFLQLFSKSRVGSTRDMLTNTTGAIMGSLMAPALALVLRFFRRRRRRAMAAQPLSHLAVWAATALLISGLVPFDLREDLGQIREGLLTAHFRPFWQLVELAGPPVPDAPTAAAFWVDFAGDVGAYVLFSAFVALAATAEAGLGVGLALFVALWSGIGLAVVIEVAQLMIASRGFDTTDMLAAAAGAVPGAVIGIVLGRLAARRRWRWGEPRRLLGAPVLVLVLIGQTAYIVAEGLEPFHFAPLPHGWALWSAIGLVPFGAYTEHLTPALVADFVLKLARYALLGGLVAVLLVRVGPDGGRPFARRIGVTMLAAMSLSAAIEITQLAIPGRYCDITDVAIAGMGALAAAIGVQWYLDAVRYARLRVRRAGRGTNEIPQAHLAESA